MTDFRPWYKRFSGVFAGLAMLGLAFPCMVLAVLMGLDSPQAAAPFGIAGMVLVAGGFAFLLGGAVSGFIPQNRDLDESEPGGDGAGAPGGPTP